MAGLVTIDFRHRSAWEGRSDPATTRASSLATATGLFTVPPDDRRRFGSPLTWLTPLGTMSSPGQNAASCSRVSPDRPMLSMVRARSAAKSSPATMEAMWITASMVGVGTDRCRARSVRNTIE